MVRMSDGAGRVLVRKNDKRLKGVTVPSVLGYGEEEHKVSAFADDIGVWLAGCPRPDFRGEVAQISFNNFVPSPPKL